MELSDQLGNIVTVILMLSLCIKSKDRSLPLLIVFGATMAAVIWYINPDIAAYYALNALLAMILAWIAVNDIDTDASELYSYLMAAQAVFCLALVVDITPEANDFIEELLELYNLVIYLIILCIGVIGSDNFLTRIYNRYARSGD